MPKYRFTTDDGKKVDRGDNPLDFADDKAATDAAQEALADMVHEVLPNGNSVDLTADVEDIAGKKIYHASLKFRGETADEGRARAAQLDAEADAAVDAVAKALAPDRNKTPN
jgi:hypothetical protein